MTDNQSLTQSASCSVRMMTDEEITLALHAEGKSEAEIQQALQEAAAARINFAERYESFDEEDQ